MATLAELLVTIGADTSGLDSGVGKSQSKLSKFGGFAKKAGKFAATGLAAAGAAAAGAAIKTADYANEIADTAPKLGISTDALQEMNFWAERNGLSQDRMERAVGRLNQRIGRAIDGNAKYSEAFKDIGVSLKDAQGNVRDTETVMAKTIQTLAGIEDPAMQSARASEIFGTKMARDLMPALQDGALSFEDAAAKARDLGIVMDGDSIEAAGRFQDSLDDLKDAGMGMVHEFGTPVMGFLADKLIPTIRDNVLPALQDFAQWIGPKLAAGGELLGELWNNVLQPAFNALSEWWDRNGPAIIEQARLLWEGLTEVFGGIKNAVQTVIDAFRAQGGTASGVWQEIREFAAEVWPQISETIRTYMEAMSIIIQTVAGWIASFWDEWGGTIMELAASWWEMIKGVISGALNVIQGIFNIFAGIFSGDWGRVWEGIKQLVDGVWQIISSIVSHALNYIVTIARSLMEKVKGAIQRKWNEAIAFIKSIPGKIKGAFSGAGSILVGIGRDIIQGLINGIKDMAGGAVSAAKGVVGDAVAGARNLLQLGSPSKLFEGFGQNIGEGLIGGLNSMGPAVSKASETLASLTQSPMQRAAAEMLEHVKSGGKLFEDFSFRGMSGGANDFNEKLASAFHGSGKDFNRRNVEQFLAGMGQGANGGGGQVVELRLSGGGGTGLERMFLSWLQGALRENPGVRLRTVND